MTLPKAVRVASGSDADEQVSLTYDERHRRRIRMTSDSGREFLLDLPKAIALADGDALELDDGTSITVRAVPEPVADIRAETANDLVCIAWHLGNRHWPTQVLEDGLRIRADHVLVEMIKGLGGEVTLHDAPFQPEGGAYGHEH